MSGPTVFLVFAPASCCGRGLRLVDTAGDLLGAWDVAAGWIAAHPGLRPVELPIFETPHGAVSWMPAPPVPAGWRIAAVRVPPSGPVTHAEDYGLPWDVWW